VYIATTGFHLSDWNGQFPLTAICDATCCWPRRARGPPVPLRPRPRPRAAPAAPARAAPAPCRPRRPGPVPPPPARLFPW